MWFSRFGAWLHHLTSVSLSHWQGQFVSANRFPSTTRGIQFMNSQGFSSSCFSLTLTQFQLGMLLRIVKLTFCCVWIAALHFYPSFRSFCSEVLIGVILSTWYKANFWMSWNFLKYFWALMEGQIGLLCCWWAGPLKTTEKSNFQKISKRKSLL